MILSCAHHPFTCTSTSLSLLPFSFPLLLSLSPSLLSLLPLLHLFLSSSPEEFLQEHHRMLEVRLLAVVREITDTREKNKGGTERYACMYNILNPYMYSVLQPYMYNVLNPIHIKILSTIRSNQIAKPFHRLILLVRR